MAKSLAAARACEGPFAFYLLLFTLLLYTSSHILGMFCVILCVILGPIRSQKTEYWQYLAVENGLKHYVTMPIAITMDKWPLSYAPSIG